MAEQNSTRLVSNAEAADVLLHSETQRLLHPFFGKEKTAAVAAKELGMSTSRLLYQINKFVDLGLLQILREEARAGRASKVYSSTSESYFVPFYITRAETLESYLKGVKQYHEQLLTRSVAELMQSYPEDWGMRVYRDNAGKLQTLTAVFPDKVIQPQDLDAAVLDFYYPDLQLDFEDAKAMQHELAEVFKKYAQRKGSQRYICHLGLAPLSSDNS